MSCFSNPLIGTVVVCPKCNVQYVFSTYSHQCSVASKRSRYVAYEKGWRAGAGIHAMDPAETTDDYSKGYGDGQQARKDAMTKASVTYGFEPMVVRPAAAPEGLLPGPLQRGGHDGRRWIP